MKNQGSRRALIFSGLLVGAILAAVLFYYYQILYEAEAFLPGVQIASVSVENKNPEEAKRQISEAVGKVYETPIRFYKDNYSRTYKLKEVAELINISRAVDEIWKQEQQLNLKQRWNRVYQREKKEYPIAIQYKKDVTDSIFHEWQEQWTKPVVNAHIEVDIATGMKIIPEKSGVEVDKKATFDTFPEQMPLANEIEVPIIVKEILPAVNQGMLQNMGEIASFVTYYNAASIDRSHNLTIAASAVNESVIQSGEVFSFNETVGPRSVETGYRNAMVIVGDTYVPGLGGGICQVSSTLYNTALLAGLEIVERHNHAMAVSYVPLGRDATVVYDLQDFQIRNNTAHPIYLRAIAGGGVLTANMYGDLSTKQKVDLRAVVDEQIPNEVVVEEDPNLAPGEETVTMTGFPGYVVRSYRDLYSEDGQLLSSEQLALDHYRPLNTIMLKGPELVSEFPEDADDSDQTIDPNHPEVPIEPDTPPVATDEDEDNVNDDNINDTQESTDVPVEVVTPQPEPEEPPLMPLPESF
ncbi:MAG: VanW family protein [Bacillota bacterium]|nr:VanW family protein [Bacillota bacterium]